MDDTDRTASLMTPAKLAQVQPRARVSPSAWLDQMASDAGYQHVRRLGELRQDLQAQATRRDFSSMTASLARVAESLPRLDFGLVQQRGFVARLTGKSRNAGAEFAARHDEIEESTQALASQVQALRAQHGEQASRTDRSLLEFEVEFRALEKIIDQGARWLQDMRNQLKKREADTSADDEARRQTREDAARCELLVARLKSLRALSSAAQQVHQQAQATAARRTALVQLLQHAVASDLREWRSRISPLAAAAREGQAGTPGLEAPMDCHRDLQLCIKQAIADCGQLQLHEKGLADSLEALDPHVQQSAA